VLIKLYTASLNSMHRKIERR